jgi:hypothetical protein
MFYIGYLKYMKSHNLVDSNHSYAKRCILNKRISWFPCCIEAKDKTLTLLNLVKEHIDSKLHQERAADFHNVEIPIPQAESQQQNNSEAKEEPEEIEEEKF